MPDDNSKKVGKILDQSNALQLTDSRSALYAGPFPARHSERESNANFLRDETLLSVK